MFPCNKMCCGFIKELPAPSTGLGKKKKSLPISHISFACYLPPTKNNLHENNQTLCSQESLGSCCFLAHSGWCFFCGLIIASTLGMKQQVVEPGYRPGGRWYFQLECLRAESRGRSSLEVNPQERGSNYEHPRRWGWWGLDFWKWMVQGLFPFRVIDADRKAPFFPASCLRCKWQVDSHQGPVLGTLSGYYHSAAGWSSPPDTGRRKHCCFPGMMMAIPLFHLVLKNFKKKKKEEENCNSNSSEWRPCLCSAHHWIASDVQHVMNV